MNPVVDGLSVVAIVEFIKRVSNRFGLTLQGEVVMILGVVVGGVLAFFQGSDIIAGALVGAAAVGGHTVVSSVAS